MWRTLEDLTDVKEVNVDQQERTISVVAGLVMVLYAVIRIPFTALIALAGGAYLLFRGIRGYCYLYANMDRNTAVEKPTPEPYTNGKGTLPSAEIPVQQPSVPLTEPN